MPPPMVPAPSTPTFLTSRGTRAFGQALDLGRLALGEEEILLGARLDAGDQLHEQLALFDDAFGIGLFERDLDRLDVRFRGLEAAEPARVGLAELVEDFGAAAGFLEPVLALGGFGQRADVLDLLGISDRVRDQLAFDQPVDQPAFERLRRFYRGAGGGHFQRLGNASDARQPLGSAGPREQAELDLGDAHRRGGDGDPIVAGERDFEAAAERGAVDRRDHRLAARLDAVDHLGQHRQLHRLAELGDVGAGEEGLAFAGDDDRVDAVVGLGLLDRGDQPLAHARAERVHRRVVRQHDQHVAVLLRRDRAGRGLVENFGHVRPPKRLAKLRWTC